MDPLGLKVYRCKRPAEIAGGMVDHHWIKTDTKEAGMGELNAGVPGDRSNSPYFTKVAINDHTGQSTMPDASCEEQPYADEDKVNELLEIGKPLGVWSTYNQCQSFATSVLVQSDKRYPYPTDIIPEF